MRGIEVNWVKFGLATMLLIVQLLVVASMFVSQATGRYFDILAITVFVIINIEYLRVLLLEMKHPKEVWYLDDIET